MRTGFFFLVILVLKEENRVRNFLVRNRASSPSLEGLLIGMAAVWGVAPAQGVNHGGRHPPTRGRHSADQRRDQHPTSASRRTLWRCLQGGGSVRKTKISIAIWLSGRIRRDGGCWGRTIRTGVPRDHEGRSLVVDLVRTFPNLSAVGRLLECRGSIAESSLRGPG